MCGGTFLQVVDGVDRGGLSPRVRGNRQHRRRLAGWSGSIPACAGEPCLLVVGLGDDQVYPRVCGGTTIPCYRIHRRQNLSPRVRGNHPTPTPPQPAGEREGLSPRVRGNPRSVIDDHRTARSIPACAGEPSQYGQWRGLGAVYPRVCGGTYTLADGGIDTMGLSPRVRGNPSMTAQWPSAGGLSPRVRGNRPPPPPQPQPRSIPACAGEPPGPPCAVNQLQVYPRVCGGTVYRPPVQQLRRGLSPRVRGNQDDDPAGQGVARSIPACAGEPCPTARSASICAVYPRVCGGTRPRFPPRPRRMGLSPRVRGNRPPRPRIRPTSGSIPACAGEPPEWCPARGVRRVYPRVCGGTSSNPPGGRNAAGLSPRVRGNRRMIFIVSLPYGSIPACAGEPMA